MKKYQIFEEKINALKQEGVYRKLPVNYGSCSNVISLNGKNVVNLSSNNYLGLANHPRLKAAANTAVDKYGVGAGSVRTIVGNQDILEKAEKVLADFKREEAVLCFQSGLNCNIGVIQAITEKGDLIISDELNHASIIDGIRLSKADKAIYRHSDVSHLFDILAEKASHYRSVFIITDGVFSMDGDIAPLPGITEVAQRYDNTFIYVDDAHGSGVLGEGGRGTVDYFHLNGQIDFIIGTLSKAIGVIGGYVATKTIVKEWLLHRARPLLFSTALPPSALAAIIEAVKILTESNALTEKLWENALYFKKNLKSLGFNIGKSETPITPVIIGNEATTMQFSQLLLEEGVFVSGIVYPTVPLGLGRCRAMPSAAHTKEDLDYALGAFKSVGKKLGII